MKTSLRKSKTLTNFHHSIDSIIVNFQVGNEQYDTIHTHRRDEHGLWQIYPFCMPWLAEQILISYIYPNVNNCPDPYLHISSSFRTCDLLGWSEKCCLCGLLRFCSSIWGRITCLLVKQGTGIFTSVCSLPSPKKNIPSWKYLKQNYILQLLQKIWKSSVDMISIPNKIAIILNSTYPDGGPRQGCTKLFLTGNQPYLNLNWLQDFISIF